MKSLSIIILGFLALSAGGQQLEVFGGIQSVKYYPPDFRGWETYTMQPAYCIGARLNDLKIYGNRTSFALHYMSGKMGLESVVSSAYIDQGIPIRGSTFKTKFTSWNELGVSFYPYSLVLLKQHIHISLGVEAKWVINEVTYQLIISERPTDKIRYLAGDAAKFREHMYFHAIGRAAFSIPVKSGFDIIPQYHFSFGLSPEISSDARSVRHVFAIGFTVPVNQH